MTENDSKNINNTLNFHTWSLKFKSKIREDDTLPLNVGADLVSVPLAVVNGGTLGGGA